MPIRQLLSTYRPGAIAYGARAPIGSTTNFLSGGWWILNLADTAFEVGNGEVIRFGDGHFMLNQPGVWYVQCRVAWDASSSTARRIIGIESIPNFDVVGGDGAEICRAEAAISGNNLTLNCSGSVLVVSGTNTIARVKVQQLTGSGLGTINDNEAVRTELNIRKV